MVQSSDPREKLKLIFPNKSRVKSGRGEGQGVNMKNVIYKDIFYNGTNIYG